MAKGTLGRRQFLKESSAAAAAFGAALHAVQAEAAETAAAAKKVENINFGIVGVGTEGGMLLQRALMQPGSTCTAVCDMRPAQIARGQKIAGGKAKGYDNFDEMLDKQKDMQALIIATPLFLHAPMTIAAIKAGLHVYCEKMMA